MKTLTIRQPWASLIVAGIKDIENRTWKTSYRGPLLIHAASFKIKNWDNIPITENQKDILRSYGAGVIDYDITSAIIGKVDLVDCVINHDSIWAEKCMPEHYKIYNWALANPILFYEPIPVKGKLSLWDYPNILAEPEEENGKLFCHCQIPVKEENQVSRFLGEEFRCNYCGGIWYK
ncbi:ASCH domain-containing protein [Rhizosphaericola mali]|uniref:ASCH domain-containing protein n=1 Tax=Rhizosphaericola mali TaxID=2545455 RepID=A0A5P2G3Y0_9BACT|nr:ASCH domain-containing protein [Rhizosphaericola mali]QES88839.1 ASCH domain-containing protein [Rhizosphaericola mali]